MEQTSFRTFRILTGRMVLTFAAVAWAATSPVQGALFSNFEPPTYASNTVISGGVDGWIGGGNGVVTPYGFGEAYGSDVLEGTQSLWMLYDNEKRSWSNSPIAGLINTNSTYVSWLLERPKGLGHSILYFSDNLAGGFTPAGLGTGTNGNFEVFSPDATDTGVSYQTNKVYRMGMFFVFTNNTFIAYAQNVTDAGPVLNLGTYHTYHAGAWDINATRSNGGLWMFDYNSSPLPATASIWDDIQIIPEPSAITLLLAVGLLAWRRSRALPQ